MSEGLLGEETAAYVLKNREGLLRYALQVLAAGPYLRRELIGELREDVRKSVEQRLSGHEVTAETYEGWFHVYVRRGVWGELGICLANWKLDASEVFTSVYNYGEDLNPAELAQIKDCLAKKSPFTRKRYSKYVWNIRPDWWNWSGPDFLLRVADKNEREVVVGEVTKDLLEIVELTDDVLKRLAKPDSV